MNVGVMNVGAINPENPLSDDQVIRIAADFALHNLVRTAPVFSAALPTSRARYAAAIFVCMAAGFAVSPIWGSESTALLLSAPFASIILVRLAALCHAVTNTPTTASQSCRLSDYDLPSYTVLVPVYDETAVAPALVEAMRALDYPPGRLQILFVTEQNDVATRRALHAAGLTENMRVLIVPEGLPRTKPRALNFALQFATGELVTVFDAEDIPEPAQLRRAAARFASEDGELVCLQARLNIYNPRACFLTRQFTLEYTALFDAILPSLSRLGWAVPLGGTSNHFRRSALISAGAWDPYNVTEDADLGFRLARLGKRVELISSTTWEEAPSTFSAWFGQRTRWLKGWMQTYEVHMREPSKLWRELGAWRFMGFQITLGGLILSALVHPWLYLFALYGIVSGGLEGSGLPLTYDHSISEILCLAILAAGYISGIALVAISVWRRGGTDLLSAALGVPLYWLAISCAAYFAVAEFFLRPSHWQKTPHAARETNAGYHMDAA